MPVSEAVIAEVVLSLLDLAVRSTQENQYGDHEKYLKLRETFRKELIADVLSETDQDGTPTLDKPKRRSRRNRS